MLSGIGNWPWPVVVRSSGAGNGRPLPLLDAGCEVTVRDHSEAMLVVFREPRSTRESCEESLAMTLRSNSALIAVLVVGLLLALLLVVPRVRRFLAVDACLDAGGRYDYEFDRCVGPPY